jgi:hypothetical protein
MRRASSDVDSVVQVSQVNLRGPVSGSLTPRLSGTRTVADGLRVRGNPLRGSLGVSSS